MKGASAPFFYCKYKRCAVLFPSGHGHLRGVPALFTECLRHTVKMRPEAARAARPTGRKIEAQEVARGRKIASPCFLLVSYFKFWYCFYG